MQQRVAESSAEIGAARRLLESICDRFDAAMAADAGPMAIAERIELRWDAASVVELSRRAIERLFAAAGAHGLYEGDPVHRAYRDISTASHHAIIDFDSVSELRGRALLLDDINENTSAVPFA
jgi:alkylation response protein AidB-like acyl-CoA dehydrogenase